MGLNKSKGNMYEWIDFTWNPIKGKCYHDCSYCYMKKWGKQNELHIDEKEFKEFDRDMKKHGEGQTIFVGSGCDIFAEDISVSWFLRVIDKCENYDNTYLFQTKNPGRIEWDILPNKSILCVTIETNRHYAGIMNNCPLPIERVQVLKKIRNKIPIYITIEPIMDFDVVAMIDYMELIEPQQINIGADSGGNNLPEPSTDKIKALIKELEKFTTVKLKKNLNRLL